MNRFVLEGLCFLCLLMFSLTDVLGAGAGSTRRQHSIRAELLGVSHQDSVGVKCSDRAMERGTVTALERERAHRPAGLHLLVTAQEIRVLHRGSA